MRLVRLIYASSPLRLAVAVLLSLATAGVNALLLVAVDASVSGSAGGLALSATYALLVLALVATWYGASAVAYVLGARIALDLRLDLARRLVALPLARLERHGKAPLYAALTEHVERVELGATLITQALASAAMFGGAILFAWHASRSMLVSYSAALAVFVGYAISVARLQDRRWTAVARASEQHLHEIGALLDGAKELRFDDVRRERFLEHHFAAAVRASCDLEERESASQIGLRSIVTAGTWLLVGLFLYAGTRMSGAAPTTGTVFALFYVISPLGRLVPLARGLLRTSHVLGTIDRLHAEVPRVALAAAAAPPLGRAIELVAVRHDYTDETGDETFSVGPIDLRINVGEILFLVGGNGSGKTTLAKILCGLFEPDGGTIRVDDVPVTDFAGYRELFSAVFTDFHLFPWLVSGKEADRATAQRLLAELDLERVARIEGDRIVVTGLSTGQRKRLALVSAFLEDRPVYLFDEWAADQDPKWKRVFYESLLPALKARNKTCVVVTHDDRFFGVADTVRVLDSGRLRAA